MPRVACDHCQAMLSAPEAAINKRVKCPKCGGVFVITLKEEAVDEYSLTSPAQETAPSYVPSRFNSSVATDPGQVSLSREKLLLLYPDYFRFSGFLKRIWAFFASNAESFAWQIRSHLYHGDSRAAVVMSVKPLLVAAYTSEFDCVAMLRFPDELATHYGLRPGSPLLTVNTYYKGPRNRLPGDLTAGPGSLKQWHNFNPFIADFLSDDMPFIEARKRSIHPQEWERALELGRQYLAARPGKARDGRPCGTQKPCVMTWF